MLKSPIYRTGNKIQNMPKIKKILPLHIDDFYDVFGGSGVVGINSGAKKVHYNEINKEVFMLMKWLLKIDPQKQLIKYEKLFKNYNFNMFSSEEDLKFNKKILNNENNSFGKLNTNYVEVILFNFEEKQTKLF